MSEDGVANEYLDFSDAYHTAIRRMRLTQFYPSQQPAASTSSQQVVINISPGLVSLKDSFLTLTASVAAPAANNANFLAAENLWIDQIQIASNGTLLVDLNNVGPYLKSVGYVCKSMNDYLASDPGLASSADGAGDQMPVIEGPSPNMRTTNVVTADAVLCARKLAPSQFTGAVPANADRYTSVNRGPLQPASALIPTAGAAVARARYQFNLSDLVTTICGAEMITKLGPASSITFTLNQQSSIRMNGVGAAAGIDNIATRAGFAQPTDAAVESPGTITDANALTLSNVQACVAYVDDFSDGLIEKMIAAEPILSVPYTIGNNFGPVGAGGSFNTAYTVNTSNGNRLRAVVSTLCRVPISTAYMLSYGNNYTDSALGLFTVRGSYNGLGDTEQILNLQLTTQPSTLFGYMRKSLKDSMLGSPSIFNCHPVYVSNYTDIPCVDWGKAAKTESGKYIDAGVQYNLEGTCSAVNHNLYQFMVYNRKLRLTTNGPVWETALRE